MFFICSIFILQYQDLSLNDFFMDYDGDFQIIFRVQQGTPRLSPIHSQPLLSQPFFSKECVKFTSTTTLPYSDGAPS